MDLEQALQALREGKEISRRGRNGNTQFLYLVKTKDDTEEKVCVGWDLSAYDKRSTDWEVV